MRNKSVSGFGAVLLIAAASWTVGPVASAGEVSVAGIGGVFNVPVVSIREARFKNVVRQRYDFSCGSAAVATLLTYHYGRPTTEEEVFRTMFTQGDQDKIRTEGFSLLDMKDYLAGRDMRANGYRVGLEKLAENGIPAVVLINTNGYLHFVVVKGIDVDNVLVADPAQGNKIIARSAFEEMSNGILFVILDESESAQKSFNVADEWLVRTKAPLGTALMRSGLAEFGLTLPGRNEF